MRTRGSYRVPNGSNGITIKTKGIKIIEDLDNEVIEVTEENEINKGKSCKRPKSDPIKVDVVIIDEVIIESDEEVQEIAECSDQSLTVIEEIDEKPLVVAERRPSLSKCDKCFRRFKTRNKVYEYNELTSADFYDNPRIHPSVIPMELRDRNRYNCYEESISRTQHLFVDKTVLVVGSGTGLLALFVAKAKAKNVIIIDNPLILDIIEAVIEKNRFRLPNKKTNFFLMRDSIEESVLPNGLKTVDIIVSDWAHHSLFYKSLIKSLIKARDKWLRKGGLLLPDSVNMYFAGAHDYIHKHTAKDKRRSNSTFIKRIDYWDRNVYGFDMTAVRPNVISEPLHEYINKCQVITNEYLIKTFNLYELNIEDINFCLPFELTAIKDHYLQTFALFFDIVFSKHQTIPIMYSTRPTTLKHMFRPTILLIESEKQLTINKNDKIEGNLRYSLSPNLNQMSIDIDFKFKNKYFDVKQQLIYKTN